MRKTVIIAALLISTAAHAADIQMPIESNPGNQLSGVSSDDHGLPSKILAHMNAIQAEIDALNKQIRALKATERAAGQVWTNGVGIDALGRVLVASETGHDILIALVKYANDKIDIWNELQRHFAASMDLPPPLAADAPEPPRSPSPPFDAATQFYPYGANAPIPSQPTWTDRANARSRESDAESRRNR
jgi:hypothetical protein